MKNNCIICGNGVVGNGEYDNIDVCGTASFGSDVCSNKVVVNGNAYMAEKVESNVIEINGACSSIGSVKCKNMFINGKFKFSNFGLNCESLKVNGKIEGREGDICSNEVEVIGIVHARSIRGDYIKIDSKERRLFNKFFTKREELSEVEIIEGKQLEVDNIAVELINCENITVGENSYIKEINCTGLAKIKTGATVKVINGASVYE